MKNTNDYFDKIDLNIDLIHAIRSYADKKLFSQDEKKVIQAVRSAIRNLNEGSKPSREEIIANAFKLKNNKDSGKQVCDRLTALNEELQKNGYDRLYLRNLEEAAIGYSLFKNESYSECIKYIEEAIESQVNEDEKKSNEHFIKDLQQLTKSQIRYEDLCNYLSKNSDKDGNTLSETREVLVKNFYNSSSFADYLNSSSSYYKPYRFKTRYYILKMLRDYLQNSITQFFTSRDTLKVNHDNLVEIFKQIPLTGKIKGLHKSVYLERKGVAGLLKLEQNDFNDLYISGGMIYEEMLSFYHQLDILDEKLLYMDPYIDSDSGEFIKDTKEGEPLVLDCSKVRKLYGLEGGSCVLTKKEECIVRAIYLYLDYDLFKRRQTEVENMKNLLEGKEDASRKILIYFALFCGICNISYLSYNILFGSGFEPLNKDDPFDQVIITAVESRRDRRPGLLRDYVEDQVQLGSINPLNGLFVADIKKGRNGNQQILALLEHLKNTERENEKRKT